MKDILGWQDKCMPALTLIAVSDSCCLCKMAVDYCNYIFRTKFLSCLHMPLPSPFTICKPPMSVLLTRDLEEAPKKARKTPTAGLAFQYAHKAAALGILYLANKGLYRACASASIKFPSPLIGAPSPHLPLSYWCYSARLFSVSCHIATTACWAAV